MHTKSVGCHGSYASRLVMPHCSQQVQIARGAVQQVSPETVTMLNSRCFFSLSCQSASDVQGQHQPDPPEGANRQPEATHARAPLQKTDLSGRVGGGQGNR